MNSSSARNRELFCPRDPLPEVRKLMPGAQPVIKQQEKRKLDCLVRTRTRVALFLAICGLPLQFSWSMFVCRAPQVPVDRSCTVVALCSVFCVFTPPEATNTGPGFNRGSGGGARGCGFEERAAGRGICAHRRGSFPIALAHDLERLLKLQFTPARLLKWSARERRARTGRGERNLSGGKKGMLRRAATRTRAPPPRPPLGDT